MAEPGKYTPGGVKTFSCPACGGTVAIRAVGISVSAVCQSCGSVIDVANEELRIINKSLENTKADLDLPLGARGQLFGAEWEIIGYLERGDEANTYAWSEYLLFNPWQGFRFLVESDGHWNFVTMLRQEIDDATYDGTRHKLFFRDNVMVKYVLGEFYWRVAVGEHADVADYIAPPYVLSAEYSEQDIIWSRGVYVPQQTIQAAFGVKEAWAPPIGIAPNQPSSTGASTSKALAVAFIALACLIVAQAFAASTAANRLLIDRVIQASAFQRETPYITDDFDIPGRSGNLEITVAARVSNDWLEIEAEFVNQDTQERFNALETIEFYYGRDSDGDWTEGSQSAWDILSAVPGGRYRLFLTADAGAFSKGQTAQYRLTVVRDAPEWSNFWTAFLMLAAAIALLLYRQWWFEQRRWANSSIAPALGSRPPPEESSDADP